MSAGSSPHRQMEVPGERDSAGYEWEEVVTPTDTEYLIPPPKPAVQASGTF